MAESRYIKINACSSVKIFSTDFTVFSPPEWNGDGVVWARFACNVLHIEPNRTKTYCCESNSIRLWRYTENFPGENPLFRHVEHILITRSKASYQPNSHHSVHCLSRLSRCWYETTIWVALIWWQKHELEKCCAQSVFYSTIHVFFMYFVQCVMPGHSNLVHSVGKINEQILEGGLGRFFFAISKLLWL